MPPRLGRPNQRRPLFIMKNAPALPERSVNALQDGDQAQNEKHQTRPLDEPAVVRATPLVDEHGEEVKSDDGSAGGVTFAGLEGVGGGGGFEEEERKEHKDLGPNPWAVVMRVHVPPKRLESTQDHQNQRVGVPQAERQVEDDLVRGGGVAGFGGLDGVVDLGDGGGDEEGEDKGGDVPVLVPEPDKRLVQDGEEREPPLDAVDEDLFTVFGELVEHEEEEEEVDQSPRVVEPLTRGHPCFLAAAVDVRGAGDRVDV